MLAHSIWCCHTRTKDSAETAASPPRMQYVLIQTTRVLTQLPRPLQRSSLWFRTNSCRVGCAVHSKSCISFLCVPRDRVSSSAPPGFTFCPLLFRRLCVQPTSQFAPSGNKAKRRRHPTSQYTGPLDLGGKSPARGLRSWGGGFLPAACATGRQRSVQTERGGTTQRHRGVGHGDIGCHPHLVPAILRHLPSRRSCRRARISVPRSDFA